MVRVNEQPDEQDQPRSGRTRPRRAEVRRQVLEAALTVFAQHGFDGASMDDVASAAGFTKGALYSNFAGKDDLFLALMDQQVSRRVELIADLTDPASTNPDAIGHALTTAALNDRDWQLLFLEYWARAVRDATIRERFLADRRRLRQHITDAAQQLLDQTERTSVVPVEQLTIVLLALSNGLAVEGLIDPDDVSGDIFATILTALTAPIGTAQTGPAS